MKSVTGPQRSLLQPVALTSNHILASERLIMVSDFSVTVLFIAFCQIIVWKRRHTSFFSLCTLTGLAGMFPMK